MLALITAILGAPAAIEALLARVQALEDSLAAMQKAALTNSVIDVQKQTETAQSDADFQKASAANAANLGSL